MRAEVGLVPLEGSDGVHGPEIVELYSAQSFEKMTNLERGCVDAKRAEQRVKQ